MDKHNIDAFNCNSKNYNLFLDIRRKNKKVVYFFSLKDFLTIGYYHGMVPFKIKFDEKTGAFILKQHFINKVSSYTTKIIGNLINVNSFLLVWI